MLLRTIVSDIVQLLPDATQTTERIKISVATLEQ